MEIISKIISTIYSSVTVKHTKICCFFPFDAMLRFTDIQNDGDSIFIIISHRALIS